MEDVQAALQVSVRAGRDGAAYGRKEIPEVLHGVYGIVSKDFSKYDVAAVIENMTAALNSSKQTAQRDFYIGVEGPYSLKPAPLKAYRDREIAMTFIGVGAEGVKTSLETSALIYAEDSGESHKYVQSGARYAAARKGAAVFMNLRTSADSIQNSSQTAENRMRCLQLREQPRFLWRMDATILSSPLLWEPLQERSLREFGYAVEWHEYAMPHSVCMEEVRDIEAWLTSQLGPASQ